MRNVDLDSRQELPLTLTIPQAAGLLGISVSKAYEAARAGDLPTVKIGVRVLVSRRRLQELIDGPATTPQNHARYDQAVDGRSEAFDTHRNTLGQK